MVERDPRDMMVVSIMLCYAYGRDEANIVVDEFEEGLLQGLADRLSTRQPPKHLHGPFRYSKRMAWFDGRNEGLNLLATRIFRAQSKIRNRKRALA